MVRGTWYVEARLADGIVRDGDAAARQQHRITEEPLGDWAPELLWHLLGVELRLMLSLVRVKVSRVRVSGQGQG